LLVLGLDGKIGLIDGIVLLVAFVAYLSYLFITAKKNKEDADEETKELSLIKAILWTVIGLVLIILGSDFTVDAATKIAEVLGLSKRFIGLTIVALGTSLPELFTSVTAARKGNADIAIGNIVGSNIFNILLVVGLSAVIIPVPFARGFIVDSIAAIYAAVLLWVCCLRTGKLSRPAGILMLLSYVVYFFIIW
jgi:cation:H+ antiporter